jgi:hypothetical protein
VTTSSRARRLAAAVAVPVVGALLLGGCTGSSAPKHTPVPGPTVGLATAAAVPGPLRIGVVVSSTSAEDEGAQDLPLAAGARVAQYRMNLRHPVDLVVQDDHGTAEGATAAVQALLDEHVAGIVYASEGEHLAPGLQLAAAAHTAVLLPYADQLPSTAAAGSARLSGPTRAQTVDRLTSSLRTRSLQRPMVLSTTDVPGLDGVAAATGGVHRLPEGGTLGQQAVDLAKAAGTGQAPADSVVVWGSGESEAQVVAAVQRAGLAVPVLLGPGALTPAFTGRLQQLDAAGGGTASGAFLTAGEPATDATHSAAMTSFLAAVRLAAADASVPALVTAGGFSADGAATADTRSHDAVVALAAAAAKARSTAPDAVLGALGALTVGPADGLAGPTLSFGGDTPVGADGVALLQATGEDLGQRAGVAQQGQPLSWFALPSS